MADKAEKVVLPPDIFACLDAKGENNIVKVDLPGMDKRDIDLNMHGDIIIHVLAGKAPTSCSVR